MRKESPTGRGSGLSGENGQRSCRKDAERSRERTGSGRAVGHSGYPAWRICEIPFRCSFSVRCEWKIVNHCKCYSYNYDLFRNISKFKSILILTVIAKKFKSWTFPPLSMGYCDIICEQTTAKWHSAKTTKQLQECDERHFGHILLLNA